MAPLEAEPVRDVRPLDVADHAARDRADRAEHDGARERPRGGVAEPLAAPLAPRCDCSIATASPIVKLAANRGPPMSIRRHSLAALAAAALLSGAPSASAQSAATGRDVAAIRACAEKYADNLEEGERWCVFALVSDPCTKRPGGQSTQGTAECFRAEQGIWNDLLNENFRALREGLDEGQRVKLRDMQRAWIAYRNTTCEFYHDKAQGSMATTMTAACLARETARRAMLLKFLQGL